MRASRCVPSWLLLCHAKKEGPYRGLRTVLFSEDLGLCVCELDYIPKNAGRVCQHSAATRVYKCGCQSTTKHTQHLSDVTSHTSAVVAVNGWSAVILRKIVDERWKQFLAVRETWTLVNTFLLHRHSKLATFPERSSTPRVVHVGGPSFDCIAYPVWVRSGGENRTTNHVIQHYATPAGVKLG